MSKNNSINRRRFLTSVSAAGTLSLLASPLNSAVNIQEIKTPRDVIDFLMLASTETRYPNSVDTIKTGDQDQTLTGIVTTFMANCEVIKKSIELGANMIITHEPTFYNHRDVTEWLEKDAVYQYKRELLDKNNIVVWRFHDYMHSMDPDGFDVSATRKLEWEKYLKPNSSNIYNLPSTTVAAVAKSVKQRLGANSVRIVGDPEMECQRIGLKVGAASVLAHISCLVDSNVDLLVAGEMKEWEISEYVRDAISAGQKKALLVVGHSESEDPGMKWLAAWLKKRMPGIPVNHIHANSPFQYF